MHLRFKDWISMAEASQAYGINVNAVRQAIKAGRVRSDFVLDRRVVYIPDLIRWRRSIPASRVRGRNKPLWDLRTGSGRAEALRSISETANKSIES